MIARFAKSLLWCHHDVVGKAACLHVCVKPLSLTQSYQQPPKAKNGISGCSISVNRVNSSRPFQWLTRRFRRQSSYRVSSLFHLLLLLVRSLFCFSNFRWAGLSVRRNHHFQRSALSHSDCHFGWECRQKVQNRWFVSLLSISNQSHSLGARELAILFPEVNCPARGHLSRKCQRH